MDKIRIRRIGSVSISEVQVKNFLGIKRWKPFLVHEGTQAPESFYNYTECETAVLEKVKRDIWSNTINSGFPATTASWLHPIK